jgi:hypothetical protein
MSKFYDFEAEDVMCNMHKMEEIRHRHQRGDRVIL